jgi:acetolactate synthase-1/2/3 large subunit
MTPRGADVVVDALAAAGVRQMFSLSGNQILSVYDAALDRGVALLHTRHEAAAVHMADGWARMTEAPGVALVTAGPGHLNAVSALYTALMSQSPVVLLSGHAPRAQRGRGAFQEVDQPAAARPVVKAAWCAERADGLGEDIGRALALARAWPPGPVHVSLPGDLLEARVDSPSAGPASVAAALAPVEDSALDAALDLLARATRPLIVMGPAMGRPTRGADVARLADATRIPALLMESPRGVNDPALRAAAACLGEADVVLLLGKALDFSLRFGSSPPFSAACRFIRVDAAAAASERVALAIAGDPGPAARRLADRAVTRAWPASGWAKDVEAARRATPPAWDALARSGAVPMHPLRVCAALAPHLADDAVLVCDGGEFGQWCQAGLGAHHRLINGPSGSIGSAVPMALGARVARPDLPVFATLGDGTFGFHALELDTAVRHRLPVVVVVGNDARWNAEHQLQLQHYGAQRAVACDLLPTRYDRVVEALGGHGEHVEHPADLEPALARAARSGRPACVNVLIDGVPAPTFAAPAHG